MCGYFGNLHESPVVVDLMNQIGIPLPYPQSQSYPMRMTQGLVLCELDEHGERQYSVSDCLWWFQLQMEDGQFKPNEKVTSFNARDLSKPLWKKAAKQRRGLVFATELGESQQKSRYLMRSEEGFALGAVYKDWTHPQSGEVLRSMAIITRPPHPRFSQYHEKSLPLFIPLKADLIRDWLDPNIETNVAIEELLESPSITTPLKVTQVKTYKRGEPLSEEAVLEAD
ncbi:hypothetical protein TDB9533_03224 [Thalassocella blandensis]|nr:hypothetical protein TDB9533_03224 [Thalassocella blandensis]